jgi:hypothetical protein
MFSDGLTKRGFVDGPVKGNFPNHSRDYLPEQSKYVSEFCCGNYSGTDKSESQCCELAGDRGSDVC